jgi:hypothetical protein
LVSDVTTYWFGLFSEVRANNWTQIEFEDLNDTDSAQAFSWQALSVPADSTLTRSVIVKFGEFESADVFLSPIFSSSLSSLLFFFPLFLLTSYFFASFF